MSNFMTPIEAAKKLKIHRNTLDKWRKQGIVKARKIATWTNGKTTYRYSEQDLLNIGQATTPMLHVRKRKGA